MWEQIKKQYWSPIGMITSVLHVVTVIIALLSFKSGYEIWYGEPLLQAPKVQTAKK